MWAQWTATKSVVRQALWGVPIIITFRDCCYCPAFVEGRSMRPALNRDNERGLALVEKWSVLLYRYERGAIYILRSPENPGKLLVKRLLALEGDWIAVPGEVDIHKIPLGHCWVEGDNYTASDDSRTKYGPWRYASYTMPVRQAKPMFTIVKVPVSLLEGRVTCIVWPLRNSSRVSGQLPPNRVLITNANAFKRSRQNDS